MTSVLKSYSKTWFCSYNIGKGHEEFEILPNGQKRYFKDLMSHKEEISRCARLNGFQEIFSDLQKYAIPKGQNFSEGNCGIQKTNFFFVLIV